MSRNTGLWLVIAVAAACGQARFVHGAPLPQLSEKLEKMAAAIKKVVADAPVKLGELARGVGVDSDVNSGTRLEQDLKTALEASGVSLKSDALLTVLGSYSVVTSKSREGTPQRVVRIELDVRDSKGESQLKLNARGERQLKEDVDAVATIATIAQVSTSLEPLQDGDKNADVRRAKLEQSLKQTTQVLKGNRVQADTQGQYAVEILMQPNLQATAQPVEPQLEQGEAFVALPKESLYIVRIHNPSRQEVGVSLTIDGLDVFHFSEERDAQDPSQPRYSRYVIPAGKSIDIPGWFLKVPTPNNYSSFQVKDLGGGAITDQQRKIPGLKVRGPVGVIQATFSLSFPKKPGGRSKSGAETGMGPPRDVQQEAVERDFDPPHEFISVRYKRAK